jgi:hypothetical protein
MPQTVENGTEGFKFQSLRMTRGRVYDASRIERVLVVGFRCATDFGRVLRRYAPAVVSRSPMARR